MQTNESWKIEISGDRVFFYRLNNGHTEEAYAPVSRGEAAIHAAAILQGYQPPRGLLRLDTLVDRTQPEQHQVNAA